MQCHLRKAGAVTLATNSFLINSFLMVIMFQGSSTRIRSTARIARSSRHGLDLTPTIVRCGCWGRMTSCNIARTVALRYQTSTDGRSGQVLMPRPRPLWRGQSCERTNSANLAGAPACSRPFYNEFMGPFFWVSRENSVHTALHTNRRA